jgi:hypothetical protein
MSKQPELSTMVWFKSSYSGGTGECLEVAFAHDIVAVRDSKNPRRRALTSTPAEWAAFIRATKADGLAR